jgi:hypothetical protein
MSRPEKFAEIYSVVKYLLSIPNFSRNPLRMTRSYLKDSMICDSISSGVLFACIIGISLTYCGSYEEIC